MKISPRFENQQSRIDQGKKSGELTPFEAKRLEKKEAKVNASLVRDTIDGGGLTQAESDRYNQKMDRLSTAIYDNKHDGQSTFEAGPAKKDKPQGARLENRSANLEKRAAQGAESGALTKPEQARLASRLERFDEKLTAAQSDGVVNAQERKQLNRIADRISNATYAQKHDAQKVE